MVLKSKFCVRMCVRALVHVPFVHLFLFPFPLFLPYFLFPPFRLSPPVPSGFTCGPRIRKSGEIPPCDTRPLQNFSKLRLKPQIGVRSRKQGKPTVIVTVLIKVRTYRNNQIVTLTDAEL